jgi:transcriptional regulator with XRE-family HTH domain
MRKPRNIVGPVVRELRAKKGLTQPQLTAKLNVLGFDISRETLAKIESQIRWIADFEISILASSVGVEPAELLNRAISKSKQRNRHG